ncbi:MAG: helix-turn-helix domain-containing protein [Treponema sp.]|jgi:transcriptional regulator with XRE-family HTH domain|nr:helix-turn-helix domain-containing protein [Treponema sp.]
MKQGRPYPPDRERRKRVKVELARRDMTISDLARALGINRGNLSQIIAGRRRTQKTEEKIAAFFGLDRRELFPPRTKTELEAMRAGAKGKAA